jgi:N-acyl-D-amino-acid deacylase
MKGAARSAMEEGALGLSTGLMYLPGRYATTDEVVDLGDGGGSLRRPLRLA